MSVATAPTRVCRGLVAFVMIASVALASARGAEAQGVTTGALRGRVLDQTRQPVAGATVQAVNRESGTRFATATNASGTFFIANVVVGPYTIEARAIGYRPVRREDVSVTLGQAVDVDLTMEASAVELEAITVSGRTDSLLARSRTGPSTFVSEYLIQNLPSLNRNFNDFTRTSPLVSGRSMGGAADRFNALQIDGGANGDLFGLNASGGSPGGRNDSRPMSIEAIREFQVLVAPFDVRQGGFTGGLINAVTRSGTNQLHGSVFGYTQNDDLQGRDTAGLSAPEFNRSYYGFSLGGPIVRDRFHFFVSTEWRREETPFNQLVGGIVRLISPDTSAFGDSLNRANVGITARTAARVRQFAIDSLEFDPGDWGRPTIPNPDRNLFFKLTGQLNEGNQIELAYNNVESSLQVLTHDPNGANPTRLREGYQYDASGYDNSHKNHSLRARLNSQLSSRMTNELIVSSYKIEDVRAMANRVSLMIVGGDVSTAFLALGGERFSQANFLEQNILEIADNLTYSLGNHVLTLGGRLERFDFLNVFFPASLGAWFFADTTAFFTRAPTRYERALPGIFGDTANGRADGPIADFTFEQFGVYAQDQWSPTRGLTLTFGLRADVTSLPQPSYNIRLDTSTVTVGPLAGQPFGVRTDSRPTDALLVSPRLGFNWDVHGNQSLLVRGGAGVFSGRAPYVWASNAYTNTGLEQLQLTCSVAAGVPAFTISPDSQPSACTGGGTLALPRPAIVYFDKDFKLPQSLRLSLGVDRRLPMNLVGTVDLLYSRAINQFILEDVNLVEGGTSVGEGGRRLYGTLNTGNSGVVPRRATTAANDVLRQFNSNKDYAYTAAFSVVRRFSGGLEFSASYAYARSYDLISPGSDISNSLLNFSTLDGTFRNRNLRPSLFDTPHNVRLSGTTTLPYGVRFSLFYTGQSGRPYAYRYNSDVNGDNFSGNDLFYVPVNSSDISLANPAQFTQLNNFILSEPCLREQRGRIMERGSCRNPWRTFVDARFAKTFTTIRGQAIELTTNMFNVLSFLGIGGQIRSTTGFENLPILNRTGYSTALSRGIYALTTPFPTRNSIDVLATRWKLEMGARYSF